ncbi:unnamed protein product (macronuclear) [Paramecium tetraurelia]|uniref:Rab-GAP TBC domain-containing protein n=1 Tax=Paramecium tetraurelia TaxID=5888 RepID=A0BTX6_PARTE|nr:uncharacterized protein GSPATT00032225001 [Paramecium tetraurelia]CAK61993.1 unnamed protein product [Paramecium tetraurelia]|eukprot:XP_001429391.1 hypothetical protein (macronuclear) [Paramecium tetraurelia strain d4-2]
MFQNKIEQSKTAFFWDILLGTYSPQLPHPSFNEINKTSVDQPQYRTLKMDIPRTRSQLLQPQMHGILEKIIVFFCQQENISYKQGMNEIFAVVAVFNESGLSWEKVYEYARKIILDNNFFKDEEFLSLQVAFQWINLLLKFHDFQLYDYLDKNLLSPELYATPWLLTLFANKMSLECTYLLWEMLYIKKDQLMIYYFVIAVLIFFREKLLSIDSSLLPQTLSGIYIDNVEILKNIYKKAVDLKLNTPSSACIPTKIFDLPKEELKILMDYYQQLDCLTLHYTESLKLETNYCRLCSNNGCVQCRLVRMPPEMKCFIYSNKHLQDLVQYVGGSIKQYKLVDKVQNHQNLIQIIKYSKFQSEQQIQQSYICFQQQQSNCQNTEEDTISTRSQNSLYSSQIIVPFKFNKLQLQQQLQKQPDDQFDSMRSQEQSNRQQSVSYRQSSIIECNILQNIHLNNTSPVEIQPLILKKDSRANSLKQDPIKRYENKGLFKKMIVDINMLNNIKFHIFRCKLIGTQKQRILVLNQGFICLVKEDKQVFSKLQGIQQLKPKLPLKTEQQNQAIQIQYLYYMIFLKRISSKRLNSNVISFYFKQPIVNSQQNINNRFFNLFKEFHMNVDNDYINEAKRMIKTEYKITLEMLTTQEAQNCIEMGKQYYKQCQF